MKLARIEHWRCGEPINWRGRESGYTYVWVADDMTVVELEKLCDEARSSYLDTEAAYKKLTPITPPGYGVNVLTGTPDTMTVGELRAEHAAKEKAYKEWQARQSEARKPFAYWLELHGSGRIKQFHEERPAIVVELLWGHNHGVTIDYSSTRIADYPFPEEEDDV